MKTIPLLFIVIAAALPAMAALGDTIQSVEADQKNFKAQMKSTAVQNYMVEELTRADGSTIKEYVSKGGQVFGVTWKGQVMPNLSQLLGTYFTEFQETVRTEPGRRKSAAVHHSDLVVVSAKQSRGFNGRAYVVSLLPSGLNPAVIQ